MDDDFKMDDNSKSDDDFNMDDEFEFVDLPLGSHILESSGSGRAIEPLVGAMQEAAQKIAQKGRVFHADLNHTDDSGNRLGKDVIFQTFCGALPVEHLPTMNCDVCKTFMNDYGDLCVLSKDAKLIPLVWPEEDAVPNYFKPSVAAVRKLFKGRSLGEEFTGRNETWQEKYAVLRYFSSKENCDHMNVPLPLKPTGSQQHEDAVSIYMFEDIIKRTDESSLDKVHKMVLGNELPFSQAHKAQIVWLKNAIGCIRKLNHPTILGHRQLIRRYAVAAFDGCLLSLSIDGLLGKLMCAVENGEPLRVIKVKWERRFRTAQETIFRTGCAAINDDEIYESVQNPPTNMRHDLKGSQKLASRIYHNPKPVMLWNDPTQPLLPSKLVTEEQPIPISFYKFCLEVLPHLSSMSIQFNNDQTTFTPFFLTSGPTNSKPMLLLHDSSSAFSSWYKGTPIKTSCVGRLPVRTVIKSPITWDHSPDHGSDVVADSAFTHKEFGVGFLIIVEGVENVVSPVTDDSVPESRSEDPVDVDKEVDSFSNMSLSPTCKEPHVCGIAVTKGTMESHILADVKEGSGRLVRYEIVSCE